MKYTGPIFRPPPEGNTLLLQVTVGCTHNKCSFCTMYKGTRFAIESMEQIEKDLQEARKNYKKVTRIFLLNADPFALKAKRLNEISTKIIEYFPEMETITMYASIRNIKHKTDAELQELHDLRINDLWVGIESGSDAVLRHLNKGYDLATAYKQLIRLKKAGIRHNGIYMLGVAGSGKGRQHAIDTAKLINATKPQLVGVTTVGFFEGSQLAQEVTDKKFIPATEREVLEEEKMLLELFEVEDMEFFGDHPINATSISGIIPEDKESMIEALDYVLGHSPPEILDGTLTRSTL